MRTIPVEQARRLALHAQGLADAWPRHTRPMKDPAAVAGVVARIGCLQLDPVAVVARSPLLVLHARLGAVDPAALDAATYERRDLFEYWAHEASLVHRDDIALHRWSMRTWLARPTTSRKRWSAWLAANRPFADELVTDLRERGPLRAREIEAQTDLHWPHGWWTDEVSARQSLARMLEALWLSGRVGIARRDGLERLWDVAERCLPDAPADELDDGEVARRAALRAVGMLGVARAPHVRAHFTRDRYPELPAALNALVAAGELEELGVAGLRGSWYARPADLEALAELAPGRRSVALSPFDNLLCDRARTAELFGFDHRLEIYTPAAKRRWGYYVLPILHGERLVARADLAFDRKDGTLRVLSLHDEPGVRRTRAVEGGVEAALGRLESWLGAIAEPR